METTTYIAISRQAALRRKMDVIAGNVANINTTGFKQEKMMFTDWMARNKDAPMRGERRLSFVQDIATYRDMTRGGLQKTEGTFDLALDNDDGFFVIETPQGPRYTRNGNFRLDAGGQLVNSEGFAVLSDADQPLFFTEADTNVVITGDGSVKSDTGEIGRLAVVRFDNAQKLERIGSSLYAAGGEEPQAMDRPGVIQGAIEESNVNAVGEMVDMIKVMRAYQSIARATQSEDERMREAIRKLTAQA